MWCVYDDVLSRVFCQHPSCMVDIFSVISASKFMFDPVSLFFFLSRYIKSFHSFDPTDPLGKENYTIVAETGPFILVFLHTFAAQLKYISGFVTRSIFI